VVSVVFAQSVGGMGSGCAECDDVDETDSRKRSKWRISGWWAWWWWWCLWCSGPESDDGSIKKCHVPWEPSHVSWVEPQRGL